MIGYARCRQAEVLAAVFAVVCLVGCSSSDQTDRTGSEDAGVDSGSVSGDPDTGTTSGDDGGGGSSDSGGAGDTSGPEDASGGDTTCDERSVAKRRVGTIDKVSEGTVDASTSDGVTTATIEAKAGGVQEAKSRPYLYVSLDSGEKLEESDAEAFTSDEWALAFKRTTIRLNGGDGGDGAWFLWKSDKSWSDLTDAPDRNADWKKPNLVDAGACELRTNQRGSLRTAFGQWYDYDPSSHVVSAPENAVYALYHLKTHRVLKLEIQSYDDATYEIRWTDL